MKTGFAFLPGTFPTGIVLDAIEEALPTQTDWTRRKINDLYTLYKEGIKSGLPRYEKGQTEILSYMRKNSNYSDTDIRVFPYILFLLVEKGDIDQKWWDIKLQSSRGIKKALTDLDPSKNIFKTINNVKWIGIVALGGVAIYFSWPILKKLRDRSK